MPNTIVTLFFLHTTSGEGWRESLPSADTPGTAVLKLPALAQKRALALSNDCQIYAYRAANSGPPKSVFLTNLETPYGGNMTGPVNEPGDCLIYRIEDDNGHYREYAMRGVADSVIAGRKLTPAGLFAKQFFDAYIDYISASTYGFNIPWTASTPFTISTIISPTVGGIANVTTASAHGYAPGDLVKIKRVRDYPFANSIWRVGQVNDSTHFQILGSQKMSFNSTSPGIVQKIAPTYSQYKRGLFNEVSWRKTGKPAFLPRGKSSTRIAHR